MFILGLGTQTEPWLSPVSTAIPSHLKNMLAKMARLHNKIENDVDVRALLSLVMLGHDAKCLYLFPQSSYQ